MTIEKLPPEQTETDKQHIKHIDRVKELIENAILELKYRAVNHDSDKLVSPNRECYHNVSKKLKGLTYRSQEYFDCIKELKPALDNHYKIHRHHPEHFEDMVDGMNLIDLLEMFLDWKAASERHQDGNILNSIKINKDRFKISDQLAKILENSARDFFGV